MIKITLLNNIEDTSKALADMDYKPIYDTVEILRKARENGNTVFTFGNGGSHSNASHFAQDLLKACGIKAICISDMIPVILAFMNDENQRIMFAEPIRWLFTEQSCVGIGFSCSGNSENIINALAYLAGIPPSDRILFTGSKKGIAAQYSNCVITVPNPNIRIQESCHSVVCHAIIEALLDE